MSSSVPTCRDRKCLTLHYTTLHHMFITHDIDAGSQHVAPTLHHATLRVPSAMLMRAHIDHRTSHRHCMVLDRIVLYDHRHGYCYGNGIVVYRIAYVISCEIAFHYIISESILSYPIRTILSFLSAKTAAGVAASRPSRRSPFGKPQGSAA